MQGALNLKQLPLFYYSLFSTLSIDFWYPKEILH